MGTLSQTLTLRAAFASSTYLLLQIHGPGRSSDDDLLIPLNPFSRGTSGPAGFPSPHSFPCPPTPARHLMMPCCSVAHLLLICCSFVAHLLLILNSDRTAATRLTPLGLAALGTRGRRLRSRRAWSSRRLLAAAHDHFCQRKFSPHHRHNIDE